MCPKTKAGIVVLMTLLLAACSGCMKIGVEIAAAPDGSTSARLNAGMDASLAAAGETTKNPFSELSEAGGNWKTREYREGNWLMTETVGSAAPGQSLFPETEKETPKTTLTASVHRLSTQYTLTLQMPPTPGGIGGVPADADEQTQALVKSMLASFEMKFALKGPGRVVATSGKVSGPGKAEWRLGFDELNSKKLPDFRLVTELPNWTNIGRLADQLAYTGRMDNAAPKLAAAVARGLLPNPPVQADRTDKLKPEDYAKLLEIIDKLDVSGRAAVTDSVVAKLKLNTDTTTAAQIAAAHERVLKLDINGLTSSAVGAALLGEL